MTLVHVPRPPKDAMNPNRPISSLLKMQVEHLYHAEKRLPVGRQSGIYVNAIKTEGEAAAYIRAVTEAIHHAHAEAEKTRTGVPRHPAGKRRGRSKGKPSPRLKKK